MKCFNHPDRDTVAICMACGRAVCRECAHDSGYGTYCRESCQRVLTERHELQTMQGSQLKHAGRMALLGTLFSLVMGIIFIIFSQAGFGIVYDLVFLLGWGFIIYGLVALLVYFIVLKRRKRSTV